MNNNITPEALEKEWFIERDDDSDYAFGSTSCWRSYEGVFVVFYKDKDNSTYMEVWIEDRRDKLRGVETIQDLRDLEKLLSGYWPEEKDQ